MYPVKEPKVDLKLKYRTTLEVSLIATLMLHILLFRALPDFGVKVNQSLKQAIVIEVEDIPPTEQVRNLPPPPVRPSVPVPSIPALRASSVYFKNELMAAMPPT